MRPSVTSVARILQLTSCVVCNICLMMSRSSCHGVLRANAWMLRYPEKRILGRTVVGSMPFRGGSDLPIPHHSAVRFPSSANARSPLAQSNTFSTSTARPSSVTSAEAEGTTGSALYSATLCGDPLSVKAQSNFGGLSYYNTAIDQRFRVLFVLGGPGELLCWPHP
jgi:hypothetical protein